MAMKRRDLLVGASALAAFTEMPRSAAAQGAEPAHGAEPAQDAKLGREPDSRATSGGGRPFNGAYRGDELDQIAFPLGGLGAGMICLEGTGALSKFSLHHRPDLGSEPRVFAALCVKGARTTVRVLEGPVPRWKLRPTFPGESGSPPEAVWGLPRFRRAVFEARFPFANVRLSDEDVPLDVVLTGWSPFSPGDSDSASLPVASVEYAFTNVSAETVEAVFSFNAQNFMARSAAAFAPGVKSSDRIHPTEGGFILQARGAQDHPEDEGYCAAWVDEGNVKVNHAWFRGTWTDSVQMIWNDIVAGRSYARDVIPDDSAPGATIFVPFTLPAGQQKTIAVKLAWYVPRSNLFAPAFTSKDGKLVAVKAAADTYRPWYAARFSGIEEVKCHWQASYQQLRQASQSFSRAFYDSTLPPEVVEAVAANLTILKSPTVLRQADGRLWAWEGSNDQTGGGGHGSCTHVWNYAQPLAHMFPDLERGLRETEFGPNQGSDGFQAHRAALPIRPIGDSEEGRFWPPVADGQLGGIIKMYREWRISGDTPWLARWWPRIRASLDYCIRTWDPEGRGWIEESHLNTYDVRFWGPDSLCTSIYLGALRAAIVMGEALKEPVEPYTRLLRAGRHRMEKTLFNGDYFIQQIQWKNLRRPFPATDDVFAQLHPISEEGLALAEHEGPPHQYGSGCLADGVLGAWLAFAAGLEGVLDEDKVLSHLLAVYRFNFQQRLGDHANVARSFLGAADEAGVLICSWPRGGRPSLPVVYADEVWTGVEYQLASHLIACGKVDEGTHIVRAARRRYDGRVRNPFAEAEMGVWYARAMSSYALLQACSGARYDAVTRILYLKPSIKADFRCFLCTATGYGTVGVHKGQPFLEVISGEIPFAKIEYTA
jgi:uncharacterized protein (DUF608 family)